MDSDNKSDVLVAVLILLTHALAITALAAFPIMLLWNWLMPLLFGLVQINFLEAFGISLLSRILFKSNGTLSK